MKRSEQGEGYKKRSSINSIKWTKKVALFRGVTNERWRIDNGIKINSRRYAL